MSATVPLSILDLSPISEGSDARQALRNSIDLAQQAEQLGYKRYWLAEHHFVNVASSSTITVIALVAAATKHIRVGSGAVQLGHHRAASVVEAFGTIDALHPGRLDLGVGRSGQRRKEALAGETQPKPASAATAPVSAKVVDGLVVPAPFSSTGVLASPSSQASAEALSFPGADLPDFGDAVSDVLALLEGTYKSPHGVALQAVPGEGAELEVLIFGSSPGQSAQVAAERGLPFVAAYHIAPSGTLDAIAAYRQQFRPSATLDKPYVVVSADVVVAESDSAAQELAASYPHWVAAIRSGEGAPAYPDPAEVPDLTPEQIELVQDRIDTQFVGSPQTVRAGLETLAQVTGADELVITGITYRHTDRVRSFELLAREWGLEGRA